MNLIKKLKRYVSGQSANSGEEENLWQQIDLHEAAPPPVRRSEEKIAGSGIVYTHQLLRHADAGAELCIKGEFKQANVKIRCMGKNLYDGTYHSFYLKPNTLKEYGRKQGGYRTTEWFDVDASKRYLNMTGDAFNRAVWQFRDKDHNLLCTQQSGKMEKYRVINQKQYDHSSAKIAIPPEAAAARVYFAKENDGDCAALGERLQIAYGLIPEFCCAYYCAELKVQTKEWTRAILIGEHEIKLCDGTGAVVSEQPCSIDLRNVASVALDGAPECVISFVMPKNLKREHTAQREYGIRYKLDDPVPYCERVGDAAGLDFNYMIEGMWAGDYPNDFDGIYPWSEVRTCSVRIAEDGERTICYEGEDGFARDGSAGEVMVEIPAYYAKREQRDGYEYLWITDGPKEGYELDPSFRTDRGDLTRIYIGAYPGCEDAGEVHSRSKSHVTLNRSMEEYQKMIAGMRGFEACDLLMHLTVQRLFLIETAVLDSQAIFEGVVYLPYKVVNTKTAYYALETHRNVNEIIVSDSPITRRLLTGDCATVLKQWKEYKNTPEYQRMIIETKKLENGRLKIRFSGPPTDVFKEKTAISALPRKTGDTDILAYRTARGNQNQRIVRGHESFRYLGIENLWGGSWINFSNCYVQNNRLYIKYPNQSWRVLGYELPVQNVILTSRQFGSPTQMCIKRMGYDKDNPLIMLPSQIGDGASTNTYYCCAWYNIAERDVKYVLCYGGAWDNLGYAGIFCYRANYKMNDRIPFIGVRLMLR